MTASEAKHPKVPADVTQWLLQEHGPLMSGEALWCCIGFKNAAAFRQAKTQGRLCVPVFSLPQRRGTFALTQDVADWIGNLAREAKEQKFSK